MSAIVRGMDGKRLRYDDLAGPEETRLRGGIGDTSSLDEPPVDFDTSRAAQPGRLCF